VTTGGVNLLFTFVAIYMVDRFGRKALMMLGAAGLAGIYGVMGAFYYFELTGLPVLIIVLVAIACYAMTLAPVTWVVLSEIFPNRVRGAAMAVSTVSLWAACFLLVYTFPFLNRALGASGSFWVFGLISLAGFFFIRSKLVETRQKSLETIEKELTGNRSAGLSG
jgi:SP family sugar porter-like MFS transporter